MTTEMRRQHEFKLRKKESLLVLGGALIFSALIILYALAPGPVSRLQHTAVTEFYSNSAPPSIPKWASSPAARSVTFIQTAETPGSSTLTSAAPSLLIAK